MFGVHFTRDLAYNTLRSFGKLIPEADRDHRTNSLVWDGDKNGKTIKELIPILREQRNDPLIQKQLAIVANNIWQEIYGANTHFLYLHYPNLKQMQIDDAQTLINFIGTTQFNKNMLEMITSLILVADQWAPGLLASDGIRHVNSFVSHNYRENVIYSFKRKAIIKSFLENKILIDLPVHAKLGKELQLIKPSTIRLDLDKVMKQFESELPSPSSYIKGMHDFNVFSLTESEAFEDDPIINEFSVTANNWLIASQKPLTQTTQKVAFIKAYVKMHELHDQRVKMLKKLKDASTKAEVLIQKQPPFEKQSAILSELELIHINLQDWQTQMDLIETILTLMGSEASHRWFYVQDQFIFKKNIDIFSTLFPKVITETSAFY